MFMNKNIYRDGYYTRHLFEELYEDVLVFEDLILRIYENHKTAELELIEPTVSAVGSALQLKYKARKITDDPTYTGLDKDDMVCFEDIVAMYRIDDLEIVNGLRTREEKETKTLYAKEIAGGDNIYDVFNVILESEDGIGISGYTLQGALIRVDAFMNVVVSQSGDKVKLDLNSPLDVEYLVALWWAGFIDEPLPFVLGR